MSHQIHEMFVATIFQRGLTGEIFKWHSYEREKSIFWLQHSTEHHYCYKSIVTFIFLSVTSSVRFILNFVQYKRLWTTFKSCTSENKSWNLVQTCLNWNKTKTFFTIYIFWKYLGEKYASISLMTLALDNGDVKTRF